jgi:pimeloyl-ACP methyl ester carboxylesterase
MNNPNAWTIELPSLALPGAEPFRAALGFASHKRGRANDAKPGGGHPVVIFPGLGADGSFVATLRAHCRSLGYDAFDWGQGFNTGPQGDLDTWLQGLMSKVGGLLAGRTQPATLIGWSLGGLHAREIGKRMAPRRSTR